MNTTDNNLFAEKVFTELESVDSTNEYAKRLLSKSKPPDGTVIFAHEQTAGKGQFGKKWESAKGENLTFSVILYPDFLDAGKTHLLNQSVSLGLKDFFESLKVSVSIKWPNDIYHHEKKLTGILIENALMKDSFSYSVVGIGINVNQDEFSRDIPNPVSLKMILGKKLDLHLLLKSFFPFLEKRYLQLKSRKFGEIKTEYQSNLYRINEKRLYKTSKRTFEGIIRGVDDSGRLIIETYEGIRFFSSTEIVYL